MASNAACDSCKDNFVVNSKYIECSICEGRYHTVCVSVKDSWLKLFSDWSREQQLASEIAALKKEIEFLTHEKNLSSKMMEQLEYTSNLQKSVIDSHQQQAAHSTMNSVMLPSRSTASSTLSFSDAVKKIPNRSSVLLIKSDSNSGNNDILRDVTTSVNPAKINVCINNTHKIRNGIAVHCQDEKSLTVLKNSLDKELGSKYSIMEARKLNPRLLIKNVNLDGLDSPESIINNIVALNNIDDTHQSDIKFVTKLKHYESTNIVIEVSPDLRNILLEKSFLFIGWKKSPVSDHIRVLKCFKCCGYGHTDISCKSNVVCPKCSQNHKAKDCKSSVFQCINCLNVNKTSKKGLPTDHASYSSCCAVFKSHFDNLRSRINYG
ncbi:unnamed protein product [Acanthoscelides obtectus]|uniref:Gag-like protein n=1 Tax=Acanthoscelides obtectus TaxID=200917 RepID=A0A9P0KVZ8_ACAOB|nr:unnamed protein product [Acanthoscelides obtectus]CAK1655908.1 hypothetical protein AOBTE_LOCUS19431 [Acanthoscelides obtectus]